MANTLIDDGYFEEVFLLTPSQAEQLMRKNQLQQGSGKNRQADQFIKYGENQREINGQDDFPQVENDPLLTKLKTWEGLGADDVISQYHRYKQLDRLNKDYLQKNIPLPAGYTLDSIINERREILKRYGKAFINHGLGQVTIEAQRPTSRINRERNPAPTPPYIERQDDNVIEEQMALFREWTRTPPASRGQKKRYLPDPTSTPHSLTSKVPRPKKLDYRTSPYYLRKQQKGNGKNEQDENMEIEDDEIEDGEIMYSIPIFDKKWKKVK